MDFSGYKFFIAAALLRRCFVSMPVGANRWTNRIKNQPRVPSYVKGKDRNEIFLIFRQSFPVIREIKRI